jgi:hypothetical protein
MKMQLHTMKNGTTAVFVNPDDINERVFYDETLRILSAREDVTAVQEIMGPSEDVWIARLNGREFHVAYDLDYGAEICSKDKDTLGKLVQLLKA